MKSKITRSDYTRLEKLYLLKSKSVSAKSLFWQLLSNIWHRLYHTLSASPELKVWRTGDSSGRIWWSACDPQTGKSIHYQTEEQMRIWIEQRHRQL